MKVLQAACPAEARRAKAGQAASLKNKKMLSHAEFRDVTRATLGRSQRRRSRLSFPLPSWDARRPYEMDLLTP